MHTMKRFVFGCISTITIFGFFANLLINSANAQQALTPPSGYFGILDNFYRGLQLQGNLAIQGQGLVTPPKWLLGDDIDIRYQPKAGSRNGKEVMFADSIIVNRFLGGQWSDSITPQIKPLIPYDEAYPWRSLDYFRTDPVSTPKGKWLFYGDTKNGDLISARLKPYMDAGYEPATITLMLSDIPWDASRKAQNSTPHCLVPPGKLNITNYPQTGGFSGDNENCNPPAFPVLWKAIISHLTQDLIAHYGAAAAGSFKYEMSDEWDSTDNVNMNERDYQFIYEGAYSAIRALLPGAEISPGGFTGNGNEPLTYKGTPAKVYDTPPFIAQEIQRGMPAADITRSLNAVWGAGKPNGPPGGVTPEGDISRAVASYNTIKDNLQKEGLPSHVIPEIHQFGFIGFPPPVGFNRGSDESSISANWTFQTLMGLKERLKPRLVTHWDSTIQVPSADGIVLLNGLGYVDLILDHYQGSQLYDLPTTKEGSDTSQTKATALSKEGKTALVLSNFDLGIAATPTRVQVKIPRGLFAANGPQRFRYLRYSLSPVDNAFVAIKRDMDSEGLLNSVFKSCALCYGAPAAMGTDSTYRSMLALMQKNWPKYQAIMKSNLKWRPADDGSLDENGIAHDLIQSDDSLMVTLGPDEMLILEGQS